MAEAGPGFARQLWWIGKQASRRPLPRTLSADGAACVTGVPLTQVHRIIDAGLLGSAAAETQHGASVRAPFESRGPGRHKSLKLAHETTAIALQFGSIPFSRRIYRCSASRRPGDRRALPGSRNMRTRPPHRGHPSSISSTAPSPNSSASLTFKGGTSLSKVWCAIRRFSEDGVVLRARRSKSTLGLEARVLLIVPGVSGGNDLRTVSRGSLEIRNSHRPNIEGRVGRVRCIARCFMVRADEKPYCGARSWSAAAKPRCTWCASQRSRRYRDDGGVPSRPQS